jgi:Ser/Thr protein kinase RdoA (MazF antagonist)
LWQVDSGGDAFTLRYWPAALHAPQRVASICQFVQHLARRGLPVAAPLATRAGAATARDDDGVWTMSRWAPGEATYWQAPTSGKLTAALAMLARIHLVAADHRAADERGRPRRAASPSMLARAAQLDELRAGGAGTLVDPRRANSADELALAERGAALVRRELPAQLAAARRWRTEPLPLEWRLGDVWHDHILFTGEEVTGVIDFAAAGVDSPAGDVARLLGSLVGDDADGWRRGLAAYESVRPLTPAERDAVRFFDESGTLLSTANWLRWLFGEPPGVRPPARRPVELARLARLVDRLAVLAAR